MIFKDQIHLPFDIVGILHLGQNLGDIYS